MHVSYIVPSFALGTLTTSNIRWLAANDWEEAELRFFAKGRSLLSQSAFNRPSYMHKPSYPSPKTGGAWVLETLEATPKPLAWLEVHCFYRGIETYFICLSDLKDGMRWDADLVAPLSLMISGLFISSNCERVLLTASGAAAEQILKLKWGEGTLAKQLIHSDLFLRSSAKAVQDCPLLAIDEEDWWERDNAKADRETLAYLVKRMSVRQQNARKGKTKKRNIFQILFGRLNKK